MPLIGRRPEITLDDIVLATDFSPASRRAAEYAVQIAQRYGARLHVVSVVDLNIPIPSGDGTCVLPLQDFVHATQKQLEEFVHDTENVQCVTHAPESFSIPQALLSLAKDCDASLIVMGTTSKGTWEKLLLGSTAEAVIRSAKIPVLTVGPNASAPKEALIPFRKIVFANDLSPQAAKALPVALAFAEDSGARIYICRVIGGEVSAIPPSSDQELENSLHRALPAAAINWCDPECVVEHGDAVEAIVALAQRTAADLIVLGARRSTFALDYIERGVTPAVIAQAECPVLSLCA